jgi:hypothetical protein
MSVTTCQKGNAELLLDMNMTHMKAVFHRIAMTTISDMRLTMTNVLVYQEDCAEVPQDVSTHDWMGVYHPAVKIIIKEE